MDILRFIAKTELIGILNKECGSINCELFLDHHMKKGLSSLIIQYSTVSQVFELGLLLGKYNQQFNLN